MTDRKNIKLNEEDYERHNERRKELGLTWAEYIDGKAPDYPEVDYAEIETRAERAVRSVLE